MSAERFLETHGDTVRNALQVHARRMREAAAEAPGGYARVFREAAEKAEAALSNLEQRGYICKRCGGPSPVGVGYVSGGPASDVDECPCGHSVRAGT